MTCTDVTTSKLGYLRAVPWDNYLQTRRDNFLYKLQQEIIRLGKLDKVVILNPNLPGGFTGIRNVSVPFDCTNNADCVTGYTREAFLSAVQTELRADLKYFPGKLIQIGFFPATDGQDGLYGNKPLWQWLYKDATDYVGLNGTYLVSLFDEFNGTKRARVSFFQEDLAASRSQFPAATPAPTPYPSSNAPNYITPPTTTAYLLYPSVSNMPSFNYYNLALTSGTYNNGITFQANTAWSSPFMEPDGLKLVKTINGSPNDGMEAAFNAYLSEYEEVYLPDIDQAQPPGIPAPTPTLNAALWAGELKSWHDYSADLRSRAPYPAEAPAGLTVQRNSSTSDLVSWDGVFGAATYNLQQFNYGTPASGWVDASGCDPSMTACTVTPPSATEYGYRVKANNADKSRVTNWAYLGVFVSESANDGYVQSNMFPVPHAAEPGIHAGRGTGTMQFRGILSFNTGVLGSATQPVGAKLRIKQVSTNDGFTLGACMVDIVKGSFSGALALEGADYGASATHTDVMRVPPLAGNPPDWVVTDLRAAYVGDINNTTALTGHTQLRLYFTGTTINKQVQWNSGDSAGNQPYLLVQYTQ